MGCNLKNFVSKYHDVGDAHLTIYHRASIFRQCITFLASGRERTLLDLGHFNEEGAHHVDLALRFEVLAVFAVFAFVGAVLLGAF